MPNEEMKPWLIQRASFEARPEKEGLDGVLRFDYMGASEFEFGALFKSLTRIRADIGNYQFSWVLDRDTMQPIRNVFEKRLMLFSRWDRVDAIVPHIMDLKNHACRLKEGSYFEAQFDPRSVTPSIVQIKKTMTSMGARRGERMYRDGAMDTYYIDSKTKKVRGPNEFKLKHDFWWDIGHDWFMFFEGDGRLASLKRGLGTDVRSPEVAQKVD